MRRNIQAGFSLVELLVAMVVTLVITGAMFGLLTGGQSAFKTQPERTDRQQNIRTSMDLIMRDVGSAGVGMPPFIQVFTPGKNGAGPMGTKGQNTDDIEMLANNSGYDNEPVCNALGQSNSSQVKLVRGTTSIPPNIPIMIIMADGTWTMRYLVDTQVNQGGPGPCQAGTPHTQVNVNPGGDPTNQNTPGGVCQPNNFGVGNAGIPSAMPPVPSCNMAEPACCTVIEIGLGGVIGYRVRTGTDGMPNLERSENGATYQIIARGIDDMQVQYVRADGAISDPAPTITSDDYNSLITQVRVTLSARTESARLQGATIADGKMALRAELASQASPRQALWVLTQENPTPVTPKWN